MSTPHLVLPTAAPARWTWRAWLALTAAVGLLHLFLLGWLPLGSAPAELPLSHRFSTRTIVIAPPSQAGGGAAAAVATGTAAAPARPGRAAPTAQLRDKPRPPPARAPKPSVEAPPPPPPITADTPDRALAEPAQPMLPAVPETPREPVTATANATAEDAPAPLAAEVLFADPGEANTAQAPPSVAQAGVQEAASAPAAASGPGDAPGAGAGADVGEGAGTPGARVPLKVPGSVRLDFAVTGQQGAQPMSGVFGQLLWLQDGSSYNARLALRVLFKTIRTQTSVGRLSAGGIEPSRFSDARRSEVATHFVRESGQIVFSSSTIPAPLMPGAQDRLSVILQLSALMAGDPERHGPGSSFSMQTAGSRDAEIWQFSVDGEEALDTPAGAYQTRKLTRLPRKEHDQKIELWLAPELGWLPVRIRQTQANGDFADMQLRAVGAP